jgi:hypothetical protein
MRDATEIETRGTPAVALITEPFAVTAASMAARQGFPNYRFVLVEHPLASLEQAAVRTRAERSLPEILGVLGVAEEAPLSEPVPAAD